MIFRNRGTMKFAGLARRIAGGERGRAGRSAWPVRLAVAGLLLTAAILGKADDTDLFLSSNSSVPPSINLLFANTCSMYDLPCAGYPGDLACGLQVNGSSFFNDLAATQGYVPGTVYACTTGAESPDCFDTTPSNNAYWGGGWYNSTHVYQEPAGCGATVYTWNDLGTISTVCATNTECSTDLATWGYYLPNASAGESVMPICTYAVSATAFVQLGGGDTLDGYDALTGAGKISRGNVQSNGCIVGVGGTATAYGTALSTGGSSGCSANGCSSSCVDGSINATLGTFATVSPTFAYPRVSCSGTTWTGPSGSCNNGNNCSYSGGILTLTGGSKTVDMGQGAMYLKDVTATGIYTLKFDGPTVLYVSGKFLLGGGVKMTAPTTRAGDLQIYSCYTPGSGTSSISDASNPNAIEVDSSSKVYGTLYAPNGRVKVDAVSGPGAIYGSISGNNVRVASNVQIHYDQSVTQNVNIACGASGGATRAVYLTGNLLNFYPPKFAAAEKAFNTILNIRVNATDPSMNMMFQILNYSGHLVAAVMPKSFPPCSGAGADPKNYHKNIYLMAPNIVAPNQDAAPMGAALLDIGEYFAHDDNYFACVLEAWGAAATEATGVEAGAALNMDAKCGSSADSLCQTNNWSCQRADVIIVTDGSIYGDTKVPGAIRAFMQPPAGTTTYADAQGVTHTIGFGATYAVEQAAAWIARNDTRPDAGAGWMGCSGGCNMSCMQAANTFALIFRDPTLGASDTLIEQLNTIITATSPNYGGGSYGYASNFSNLMSTLIELIRGIVSTSRTFSAPFIPTLTTKSSFTTYMASFIPAFNSFRGNLTSFWEGHLRAYPVQIVSQFNAQGQLEDILTVTDACGQPISNFTTAVTVASCGASVTSSAPTPLWDAGACLGDPSLTAPKVVTCANGGSVVWKPCYKYPDERVIYTMLTSDLKACHPPGPDAAGQLSTTWVPAAGGGSCSLDAPTSGIPPAGMTPFDLAHVSATDLNLAATGLSVTTVVAFERGPKVDPPIGSPATVPIPVLGDIFHSGAVVVNVSPIWGGDSIYARTVDPSLRDFVNYTAGQQQIILAGANDGMLHAFDGGFPDPSGVVYDPGLRQVTDVSYLAGTGTEVWAFIPHALLGNLQFQLAPPPPTNAFGVYITTSVNHVYFMDAPPTVRDVYLPGIENGFTGTVSLAGQTFTCTDNCRYWHTVILGGLRFGGKVWYALDVTQRNAPRFLWEFEDPELAFTWEDPGASPAGIVPIAPFNLYTGTQVRNRFVALLNGGLSVNQGASGSVDVPDNAAGRANFIVDIATGSKIWQMKRSDHPLLTASFPASPKSVDIERNGWADALVAGDINGTVWMAGFANSGARQDPITRMIPTSAWAVYPEYAFGSSQSFWTSPQLSADPFGMLLAFLGAGDLMSPFSCPTTPYNFFMLRMTGAPGTVTPAAGNPLPLSIASIPLAPIVYSIPGSFGWRQALTTDALGAATSGQKVQSAADVVSNIVLYGSYVPGICGSAGSCQSVVGNSILNTRAYLTGATTGSMSFINLPLAQNLGPGLPGTPKRSMHVEGSSYSVESVMTTTQGNLLSISSQRNTFKTKIGFLLDVPGSLHANLSSAGRYHLSCPP